MHDYPPIESGVEQLLYNLYNWLGEPSRDVVRYMQELNREALTRSTYSTKLTHCSVSKILQTVKLHRLDPALGMYYPEMQLQFLYTSPTRWTCELACGNTHLYFSSFSTLHDHLKLFFGAASVAQQPILPRDKELKPTTAPRRIVEL